MHSNGEHEVPYLPRLPDMLYEDRHPIVIQDITELSTQIYLKRI